MKNLTLIFRQYAVLLPAYFVCCLLISFAILYNVSEAKYKSELSKHIYENFDTNDYPVYIIKLDSRELMPVPAMQEDFSITIKDVESSGQFLIYNAIENKLYNVPQFSKNIYTGNYKISFAAVDSSIVITFALNYP